MSKRLIYEEDAIDAINDLPNCSNGYSGTYDKASIILALKEVPSAQQKIIRCKDCRYYKTYQYVNGRPTFLPECRFLNVYVAEEDFCSQAERRKE